MLLLAQPGKARGFIYSMKLVAVQKDFGEICQVNFATYSNLNPPLVLDKLMTRTGN